MKTASGTYFNMYCEIGYEDYGIPGLDIFFLFPESYTHEECKELFDDIETRTRETIRKYADVCAEGNKTASIKFDHSPEVLKMALENTFEYLEIQIIVKINRS